MAAFDGATCYADAYQVVLRPCHWTIALDALVAGLPGFAAGHRALPVHCRRGCGNRGEVIRDMLQVHWGFGAGIRDRSAEGFATAAAQDMNLGGKLF